MGHPTIRLCAASPGILSQMWLQSAISGRSLNMLMHVSDGKVWRITATAPALRSICASSLVVISVASRKDYVLKCHIMRIGRTPCAELQQWHTLASLQSQLYRGPMKTMNYSWVILADMTADMYIIRGEYQEEFVASKRPTVALNRLLSNAVLLHT
ncbi:hypothetical protein K491DRAFT_519069 [Lophiostoma macrostomum CBS 122681]|uniref:Uncharacterized protein n=1 Tax=Lophiostoma macrostomum CBS 122681 TaxID=1314788 RepID=A0A6A6T038_9PLEO|nr:hypothetical protein K491DRAFT_519069 [Lophiostoma macrostomum CBS 122681]